MLIVHCEKLKNEIESGLITNGILVRDLECMSNDPIFFRNNKDAQEYIQEILKFDLTRKFLVADAHLKKRS